MHPAHELGRARRADHHALRRGAPDAARNGEVPARRPAHRHRRRQSHGARRGDAGRQPVAAPARSAAQPARLLAQSPVAVVSVLGAVLRPDEPASARRRRAQRLRCTSSRSRSRRCRARGDAPAPWLVDRVFRHLLVDITGNTHRAEFCIDKLYAPETSSGRQGLVELRSFEMPPHARMSLAQQLLLRALVARFWKTPYNQPLVRWGTELHDRFMLPHFVAEDLGDVLDDLGRQRVSDAARVVRAARRVPLPGVRRRSRGAACTSSCGRRSSRGTCSARSRAPAARSATWIRRSSGCRSRSRGMTESRHFLACNGRAVPLHPTGTAGEFVAGVRYRAWQPPSCLHPTIARARAARVRSRRRVERAIARRLHLPRRASRRPQLRDLAGERLRSGRPPARALSSTSATSPGR